ETAEARASAAPVHHTEELERSARAASGVTWCDWLTRAHPTGKVRIAEAQSAGAREAVTRVRLESRGTVPLGCRWLRLHPVTGRTHKLRAQAAARAMPVLGDRTYGACLPFEPPEAIALHAWSLQVRHPILGTDLKLCAPPPPAWTRQGIL